MLYFIGEAVNAAFATYCTYVCIWKVELHMIHLSVVDPQRFVMKWRCTMIMGCHLEENVLENLDVLYISRQT